MASVYDFLNEVTRKNGQSWTLDDNKIYITTSNPYGDYRKVLNYDITKMYPETIFNNAIEYWKRDEEDTEKLYKNWVDAKWDGVANLINAYDKEKETEMKHEDKVTMCLKDLANRYNLKFESRYHSIDDKLIVLYERFNYQTRNMENERLYFYNVSSLDIKTALDDAEEKIIRAFNLKEKKVSPYLPNIKNVIHNDPTTIVFWADNTKTVVKCQEDDIYDPEKGLAMAISKKALGNQGNYCNTFKKWLPEEVAEDEITNTVVEHVYNAVNKVVATRLKKVNINEVLK